MSELNEIIQASTFKVEDGLFVYAKVSSISDLTGHFMISCDAEEISVVTREENISKLNLIERNKDSYTLICLNVSIPFYSVGLLASVSREIAALGLDILIVSTYSKDYIMVRGDKKELAISALLKLGFKKYD